MDWKMCDQDNISNVIYWCNLKAKIWEDEFWFLVKHNCREDGTSAVEGTKEKSPSYVLLHRWYGGILSSSQKGETLERSLFPLFLHSTASLMVFGTTLFFNYISSIMLL